MAVVYLSLWVLTVSHLYSYAQDSVNINNYDAISVFINLDARNNRSIQTVAPGLMLVEGWTVKGVIYQNQGGQAEHVVNMLGVEYDK